MNRRRSFAVRIVATMALTTSLMLGLEPSAAFGGACGPGGSPATPVPQFDDDLAPGVSLWPLDQVTGHIKLQPAGLPAGITRPEVPALPPERDSTDFASTTVPGEFAGHELFRDLAIPDSRDEEALRSDWLVVVYGAGLQVWDLASDPAEPVKVAQADGWSPPSGPGDWAVFPGFSEEDTYLFAVDVVEAGDLLLIGTSASSGVGFALWSFDTTSETLQQLYQDLNVSSYDLSMVEDPNGRIYAFVADVGSGPAPGGGVRVYDVTTAASGGLCVDLAGSNLCGYFEGEVGDIQKPHFVSAIVATGETHVAASDGYELSGALQLEIWQVADPDSPGSSALRFDGLGTMVSSPQLFSKSGSTYLGVVENLGANPQVRDQVMRIYDVSACVGGVDCVDLGAPKAEEDLATLPSRFDYLDVSFSDGTPFAHYGLEGTGTNGSEYERLWDLGQLPATFTANTLPEITDGGGSYVDPCSGEDVNYFGDYFPANAHGLRAFEPRHAVFTGRYLYRAATSVLDVHERFVAALFSDGFESGDCAEWSAGCP